MKSHEDPIVKFSGGTSSIELYSDYLIIKPSFLEKLSGSEKTIPLDAVVTVSIVQRFLMTPYLQIVTPGMVPSEKDIHSGSNANVVLIQPFQMKKAKQIQEYVSQYKNKKLTQAQPQYQSSAGNELDYLKKLNELKECGIITEEEFTAKKRQLLGI